MPNYNISTGLPQTPSGVPDADFNRLLPLYQAMNTLARNLSEADGRVTFSQVELAERNQLGSIRSQNHRRIYPLFPAAIGYGKLVNLYVSGGKLAAQLADASTNTLAHGIVNQQTGAAAGDYAEVILIEGFSNGIAGSVLGAQYWLSTNGDVQAVAPGVGAVQPVGWGLGSAGFYLHIESPSGAGGGSPANLSYTASPTDGTVVSSSGTDATLPLADGTNAGLMAPAQVTKLAGIAAGATVNSSDAALLDRANHTGTQLAATISDFSESVDDRVAALLVAGANITLTYNDVANTLTIAASGGGGGGATVGTAVLDFGATPTLEASVVVTGQAGILTTSAIDAFVQESSTVDNTTTDHLFAGVSLRLVAGNVIAGTGFTIYATSLIGGATGTFNIKWRWQ